MAIGNIHIGTIAGKLNGVIPTVTPKGCIVEWISIPRPACSENSPFSKCGIPHANSTTSRPRVNSPQESEYTLPCSSVINRAKESQSLCNSSLNLNSTRARRSGEVAAHPGNAAWATSTASLTSSGVLIIT